MKYIIAFLVLFANNAVAHEMTPAYPELEWSFVDGVVKTKVYLFNRRQDVKYYQIEVFDNQWEPLPFATESAVIMLDYLSKKTIEIYIREVDADKVGFICSKSKIIKGEAMSLVSSRICSRIK